ncbi:MAG: serine/threonine-protein kinase [Planctomycetota bacterium]
MNHVTPNLCECGCNRDRMDQFLQSDRYHIDDPELISQLDSCKACCDYMEAHAASAELRKAAAELLVPDEFDSAGTLACSAANIERNTEFRSVAVQDALDSLAPSEHPDHLGRIGSYEITGVVGVGAMGVVLKAIDPSLDRVVAIKMMAPQLANNEMARKRFLREAKAAAAVLHPNVIPIHSVSSGSRIPFLVMSYIRGGSLQKRLVDQDPLPLLETLRIGAQIAAGLEAAHEQGLVHRDIKPENILMEEGVERVTITDFGLARAVDDNSVTQHGTIAGTPMYMSPEQARGEQVDQQSDLFSFGSVMYALCTGHPPYRAYSSYGVMRRIIDEEPTPIRERNPQIPSWLASIVERLMAKEQSERFRSASEVHELLDACLRHVQEPKLKSLPDFTESIDDGERNRSLANRRRLLLWLSMLMVGCFAFTYFAFFREQTEKPLQVGGGGAVSSDGWFFSSGQIYLQQNQPGVLFGMHENPSGDRELSYVVLFRHHANDRSVISRPSRIGTSFDGQMAKVTDGISIDGRAIEFSLSMQVDAKKTGIASTTLTIDGKAMDYNVGRLLLVDLTGKSVTYSQVNAKLPTDLPIPRNIVEDTDFVAELAKRLMRFESVRKYLAESSSSQQSDEE